MYVSVASSVWCVVLRVGGCGVGDWVHDGGWAGGRY